MRKLLILIFTLAIFTAETAISEEGTEKSAEVKAAPSAIIKPEPSFQAQKPKYKIVPAEKLELSDRVLNYSLMSAQLPQETVVYSQVQRYINAINPKKENNINANYPGLRGPNQLIVYTPLFGERTGTNEFGTEAIVQNNMVVSLNGADSVIPKNGFVISGHGSAKTWISKNIQIGSKVYIDYFNNQLQVYLTPDSLLFAAKMKIEEVNNLVDYYKHSMIAYNDKKTADFIDESKSLIKKAEKKQDKAQTYISQAMSLLDDAIKNAIPYKNNELKGIWIRPVETTPEGIKNTVQRISNSGITDIFLETYFHGKTIYPSRYLQRYGVISQKEEFAGFDPLAVWIDEAHKHNMKLHIWFESFYAGVDNPKNKNNLVLSMYPMWANKRFTQYDSTEPLPCASEHNGYFLDPANNEVQYYLIGLLKEIIDVYKPDGINLDYIRYPQSVDSSFSNYVQSNWGYTQYARNEFMNLYGIDPVEITYGTEAWDNWAVYRQEKITNFVKQVKALTKDTNILLTAVIFPDLSKCKSTKMQDWKEWSVENIVDGLTPLLLTGDKNTADLLLNNVFQNTNPSTKIYPGIFVTFMGGSFEDLLIQIHKTREFKAKGAVLFDYAHLKDKYVDALVTRIFNNSYEVNVTKSKENKNYVPEVRYKDKKKDKKRD